MLTKKTFLKRVQTKLCVALRLAITVFVSCLLIDQADAKEGADEKIEELNTELGLHPENTDLYYQMAEAQCMFGDAEESQKYLVLLDHLAPGKYSTELIRARNFVTSEHYGLALEILNPYLKSNPASELGLTVRARVLGKMGKTDASLADYRSVLRLTEVPSTSFTEEFVSVLVANELTQEALQVLDRAIERNGLTPSLVLHDLELSTALGKFDRALKLVQAMQVQSPRPEIWIARRAELLAGAGRMQEARATWQSLLAHLDALPNLQRGSRDLSQLAAQARSALSTL